jgi:hypothetical protein
LYTPGGISGKKPRQEIPEIRKTPRREVSGLFLTRDKEYFETQLTTTEGIGPAIKDTRRASDLFLN